MLRVIFAPKSKEMLVQILVFANVLAALIKMGYDLSVTGG